MRVVFTHKRIIVILAIILLVVLAGLYVYHGVMKSIDQFYFHDHPADGKKSN